MTALHLIVMMEKWDLLEVALEDSKIFFDATDEYSNSIMHYTALNNNYEMLGKLMEKNTNIFLKNFEGEEPLHVAIYKDSLECFVAILNKCGRSETHEEYIQNKRNNNNENCFHLSIIHRASKIFSYCVAHMKKLDMLDENQKIAIMYLIDYDNLEFLDSFLAFKTNIKVFNNNRENVLFYCLKSEKTRFFKKLLPHYDDDFLFNKNRDNQTLLHFACMYNNPEAARILLEANLDKTESDSKGKTPLNYAEKFPAVLKVLQE